VGKFPDGRVKLDVYFEDSQEPLNNYVWTPQWKETRSFFLEAFRVEKLNKQKGQEVEKFKQTARKVASKEGEEEIESYKEIKGNLRGLEEGRIIVHEIVYEGGKGDFMSFFFDADRQVKMRGWKIPLSIDFEAKIMAETGNLRNWLKRNIERSGKWIIINQKLFDVEWKEKT